MADDAINPRVNETIADLSGERVAEGTAETMPRHFWSALKNGHYRFAVAGIAIAAPIGLAIGAAFVALAGITGVAAAVAVAGFMGAGMLMAAEGFGAIGSASASRASGLAEKHARILDADSQGKGTLSAVDDKLMVNGKGHHYGPATHGKHKMFHLQSGLMGAGLGAAIGAVMGLGLAAAGAAEAPVIGTVAVALTAALPMVAPAAALAIGGAIVLGLFGLTFGIERGVFKNMLNQTDAYIEGKKDFIPGQDLGRQQSMESPAAFEQHRARRQVEIDKLEKAYNERISWGAVNGRFRGFAAAGPGALVGAIAGAVVLAGIAIASGGLAAVPMAGLIIPAFAAGGGLYASRVASESFMEAGAEASARAIDNEFERNRALRARGITPPTPKEPDEKGGLFSGKSALLCGLVGAAIGIALAPVLGVGAMAIMGAHVAAFSVASVAASAIVSGLVGASYGITTKGMKAMTKPVTDLYDGISDAAHPSPSTGIAPAITQPQCEKITAEDMARMNERTAAASSKSFVQSVTSQPGTSATLAVGA